MDARINRASRVVLIEDDPEDAEYYKRAIEEATVFEVSIICPPPPQLDELVALIEAVEPDAIIIDERLPARSDAAYTGIDVVDELRVNYPYLPVVILTGYADDYDLRSREDLVEWIWNKREFEQNLSTYFKRLERRLRQSFERREIHDEVDELQRIREDIQAEEIPADRVTEALVSRLAQYHFETEPSIELVASFSSPNDKEIRFIEVNRTTVPTGDVDVFAFAATEGFPFRLLIGDVTPKEWKQIKDGNIVLPEGWDLDSAMIFERSSN